MNNQSNSHITMDLKYLDLENSDKIYWNLTPPELYEEAIRNGEAELTDAFALRVRTGGYTGRSPEDRFIVDEPSVHDNIDWGKINRPVSTEVFNQLYNKVVEYLNGRKLYVKDLCAGADPDYRLNVRVVSETAYHGLFSHNMFIRSSQRQIHSHYEPDFTVLAAPNFQADPKADGTRSVAFVFISFEKKIILIGGTLYSGEIKKGIFSVMNYLLPSQDVMPMHCSANMNRNGSTAIFFGLSGTGKTTLSSDSERILIGDDEHGWSPKGIFNIEGGCYAKTINLSKESEPLIYAASCMPGTILENVVLDSDRHPDFTDNHLTQNTRCSYPIDYIPMANKRGMGNHPTHVVFLTCDAFGVLPPIARLTPEQAMYHFISGYTAKVAGTERGVTDPEVTFSACFGAPFMPLHPTVYAELLAEKILDHGASVWLINTGWSGGPYGIGSRIRLAHTRNMLSEALNGNLSEADYSEDPFFGLAVPKTVNRVPTEILIPSHSWHNKQAYRRKALELAGMFIKNFENFKTRTGKELEAGGPNI